MNASILIVDDEEVFRDLLTVYLAKEGHRVSHASDCASLREAFSGPTPDVVLLDLALPDGSGLGMIPELKQRWPDTRIIIVTGHGTEEVANRIREAGGVLWLTKPFDSGTLKAMVELALG